MSFVDLTMPEESSLNSDSNSDISANGIIWDFDVSENDALDVALFKQNLQRYCSTTCGLGSAYTREYRKSLKKDLFSMVSRKALRLETAEALLRELKNLKKSADERIRVIEDMDRLRRKPDSSSNKIERRRFKKIRMTKELCSLSVILRRLLRSSFNRVPVSTSAKVRTGSTSTGSTSTGSTSTGSTSTGDLPSEASLTGASSTEASPAKTSSSKVTPSSSLTKIDAEPFGKQTEILSVFANQTAECCVCNEVYSVTCLFFLIPCSHYFCCMCLYRRKNSLPAGGRRDSVTTCMICRTAVQSYLELRQEGCRYIFAVNNYLPL